MLLNDVPQAYALRSRLAELKALRGITALEAKDAVSLKQNSRLAPWWAAIGPDDAAREANKWATAEIARVKAALVALGVELVSDA